MIHLLRHRSFHHQTVWPLIHPSIHPNPSKSRFIQFWPPMQPSWQSALHLMPLHVPWLPAGLQQQQQPDHEGHSQHPVWSASVSGQGVGSAQLEGRLCRPGARAAAVPLPLPARRCASSSSLMLISLPPFLLNGACIGTTAYLSFYHASVTHSIPHVSVHLCQAVPSSSSVSASYDACACLLTVHGLHLCCVGS